MHSGDDMTVAAMFAEHGGGKPKPSENPGGTLDLRPARREWPPFEPAGANGPFEQTRQFLTVVLRQRTFERSLGAAHPGAEHGYGFGVLPGIGQRPGDHPRREAE